MCYGCYDLAGDIVASQHTAVDDSNWATEVATVHMPIDIAHHYRMQGEQPRSSLTDQIRNEGIREPITLNTDGESGYIADGHHRLDSAGDLGMTHVPVRVNWINDAGRFSAPIEDHLLNILRSNSPKKARTVTVAPSNRTAGLSFHPIPGHDTAYKAWLGDKPVGRIMWAGGDAPEGVPPYQVQHIDVHPDHLRQGIASALFNHVQQNVEPRLRHSDQLSESGEAFARSMGHSAAWDGTTAEPSSGWKPAATPYIARGINVSHPEDDHDMFHAINEGRATPEHMRRLVTNGGTGNAGVWWGTYSHPDAPDPHAYGNFEDFAIHAGEGANPSESVANYHDSGEYHERTQDRKAIGKADSIFAEVPTVMVGKRPKRGDAQWDPELHNPSNNLMGNSYLDDNEPVDLHEVHYHNGRDWHMVPMGGHQVTARWQDYHQERQRQEQALDEATGGYAADKQDYFDRGGQPLITFKDWIKGNGGLQNHNDQARADFDPNYVHTPDPSYGVDAAPAW